MAARLARQCNLVITEAALRLELSREGWLQPWVRLRDGETAEQHRLAESPPYQVLNRIKDVKPGATTLATATDGKQRFPALISQRFGRGRSAVLALGDFWHSGLGDEKRSQDLAKCWRQMVRFLVAEVPGKIEISAEPATGETGQGIKLRVTARDDKFQPLDNATTKITLHRVEMESAKPLTLSAEPSATEAGIYEAFFTPRDSGGYKAEGVLSNDATSEIGRSTTGWSIDFNSAEFASLTPNRALLETIARKTGGEMVAAGSLEKFVGSLATRRAPVTENWTRPLWHTPVVFLFALGCFVAEWGLRRWKGLP